MCKPDLLQRGNLHTFAPARRTLRDPVTHLWQKAVVKYNWPIALWLWCVFFLCFFFFTGFIPPHLAQHKLPFGPVSGVRWCFHKWSDSLIKPWHLDEVPFCVAPFTFHFEGELQSAHQCWKLLISQLLWNYVQSALVHVIKMTWHSSTSKAKYLLLEGKNRWCFSSGKGID